MLLECTSWPDPHHVAGTKATSSKASLSSCIMVVLVGGELLPQDWSWKIPWKALHGLPLVPCSTRVKLKARKMEHTCWPTLGHSSALEQHGGDLKGKFHLRSGNGFLEEGQLCGWQKTCINTHTPR